ncbi:MAG: gliding motility protein GldN [Porphyromonadaceae bacterium]|nr:MAG: gliding motility protein GldN [Porphyromonadaceae bacterium]
MKKVRVLILALLVLAVTLPLSAQVKDTTKTTDPSTWSGLDLVYKKEHIFNKKPIEYPHVREADIMWSKVVWRMIDLREKMNQPLYYPTKVVGDRTNLIDLLLQSIKDGGLQAYSAPLDDPNEFKEPISYDQVMTNFDVKDRMIGVLNVATGLTDSTKIKGEINLDEVLQIMIKEMWFFDRKRSVLDVRIIGICPIRVFFEPEDINKENIQKKKLFWVKYPEARPFLAQKEVFNAFNDSEMRSFDEIFYKRFFTGFIVQESNVYNNRIVADYTLGVESLQEAERIENLIFQFEHDLWEY